MTGHPTCMMTCSLSLAKFLSFAIFHLLLTVQRGAPVRRHLALCLLGFVFVPRLMAADTWVGEKVMQKSPKVKFDDRIGDKHVYLEVKGTVYSVLEVTDGFLRIRDRYGREGWVDQDDMVLLRDAPAHYTDLIRANDKDRWAWNQRGAAWQEKGDLDNAIKDYTEAIRIDPKDTVVFNNRGNAWLDKKNYDKATKDYDEAIRLDPKYAKAFYNRGNAWLDKKDYAKAIKDYDEAIRLDAKNADAFYNRGHAWSHNKAYDKAIKDYNEAIRLDPRKPDAFCSRGHAWSHNKAYDKSIKDYDEAIRLDSKDFHGAGNKAELLAICPNDSIRDGRKALELAKRACELSEFKEAWVLAALAAAHAELGQFQDAVKWQKKAMEDKEYTSHEDNHAERRLKLYQEGKPYHLED
jgi:tetratricopeptide (TPR) repeat protein